MTVWWLAFIAASLLAIFAGFVYLATQLYSLNSGKKKKKSVGELNKDYSDMAEEDVDHLFNKEFREELRNRGRLRFEKIIDENAMFLKQDLDMTISQLNEYMKSEISKKLNEEFAAYAKAMHDAQELALSSLQKTATDVEQQRLELAEALKKDVERREQALLQAYQENMSKVVEHYLLQALGDEIDLKAQLPFIVRQMEANKQNIMEDMRL
ncbi:hypothetical protein EYC59_02755 [Candidatus Saccharibacteria bacterium]|nr:MAG: hypothetical protein EYC59_02755 [Candidatus Saccharibacteria bacterium]